MNSIDSRIRSHPFWSALILVGVVSVAALAVSAFFVELKTELYKAVITLIFSALIGGVLKILLDNYTLNNQQRASNVTFVTNVLADLKSAYDGVAHIRFMMAAHQSAKTYGDEMFNLNQFNVQLHNVVRALETRPDTLSDKPREEIRACVTQMRDYLKALIDEFQCIYRDLADRQRIYEAQVAAALKDRGQALAAEATVATDKQLWAQLQDLSRLSEFISRSGRSQYQTCFVEPLNEATKHLRAELARIARGDKAETSTNIEARPKPAAGAAEQAAPQPCPSLPAA